MQRYFSEHRSHCACFNSHGGTQFTQFTASVIRVDPYFSTVAASNGGKKVYAYSSNDPGRSLVVSGSVESLASSMESSVEENSSISTTGDATNYSMTCLERAHNPEQKMSTATSSNGITRKLHGRKCVPQRSPFF
ncbi:hypothetical protein L1987_71902 [Smallanthus sonchifolius]|uniref:Uncharacterized protein n=1 Tax=Smallanthus sonchifolius TaxID=185202 RepID=A0ACB9AT57_9ASTR|nr:hypothetical protein L1987_71902 [Smallanthus sonchifolius]